MKKTEKIAFALIVVLTVGLIVSMVQINNLRWQIENTRHEMHHFNNNVNFQIGSIFSQVDDMINRQMSLIELASTDITSIDIDGLAADITFSLTPRQVSPYTAVSLDFSGEIVPMQRDGQVFSVTIPRDIFGDVRPMILIDENGTINTTQDNRIGMWSIMHEIFPTMAPSFSGTSSHGNGRLRMNGHITVRHDRMSGMPISFVDFTLVTTIDGVVTSEIQIPFDEATEWAFDKNIALADHQTLVLTVVATDSTGLEHHATVWTTNRDMPRALIMHGHDLRILRNDGTLLWQREWLIGNEFDVYGWR